MERLSRLGDSGLSNAEVFETSKTLVIDSGASVENCLSQFPPVKFSSVQIFPRDGLYTFSAEKAAFIDGDGFWVSAKLQQQHSNLFPKNSVDSRFAHISERTSSSERDKLAASVSCDIIGEEDTQVLDPSIEFCAWPPKHLRFDNKRSALRFRGATFASLTEAALAGVLERFVPGFLVKEGETYEVPLLGKSRVDFCIQDVLVEFHAPRLGNDESSIGDFLTKDDFRKFKANIRRVGRNKHQRKKLLRETRAKVFDTYVERRRTLLRLSPRSEQELIIVRSREEFYESVLCRFAVKERPLLPEFLAMFWWLVDVILRENNLPGLRSFSLDAEPVAG